MLTPEREGFLWILAAAAGFAFIPTIVKTVYSHSSFETARPGCLALYSCGPAHVGIGRIKKSFAGSIAG